MTDVFDFGSCMSGFDIMDGIRCLNNLTDVGAGGILGIIFLIIVGGAIFFMSKSFGNERAFGITFFITGILGVMVRVLGLINDTTLAICILLAVFGFILLIREGAQYEQ